MRGTYNFWLITLSVAVAVLASYVALDLTARVRATVVRSAAWFWLAGGAATMGVGIWSMHFIGMLAFRLPMPMTYDTTITLLSLLIAIVVSGFALYVASRSTLSLRRLISAGILMGLGIASMHYTGMAAMRIDPAIQYDLALFGVSVLIAIVAATAALRIAFGVHEGSNRTAEWSKLGSAVLMGAAIAGMHYTGMAAAVFPTSAQAGVATRPAVDVVWLAGVLGAFTTTLLAATLLVSMLGRRFARDVSELDRAGEALQASKTALETERQFLAVLLENLSDGIVACDERGILTVFNRATRELHGLPEEPLPSDQWSEHYDLYDADGQTPLPMQRIPLFRALQGEAIRNVEMVVKPRGRAPHTLLCNGRALVSSTGTKLGAVVAMHDVTERKHAETELERIHRGLAENQQRLEEAQTIARIGSWEWDVLSNTVVWSEEMHRIHGVNPDAFVPSFEGYLQHVHPDDRERVDTIVHKAWERRELFEFEHCIVRPDGAIRMMQAKGRVILDETGTVVRMLGTAQDVTEIKEAEQRLQQLAHFDPLTALPNRLLFYESLHAALIQATEHNWIVSVLFLDIDHFKTVNDTMGHASGDELLRQLGRRLVHSLRVRDTVGRLGGDEFAIILMSPNDPENAAIVANKLRDALRPSFVLEGREVTVTASMGITVFPDDSTEAEVLIKYADTAMYAAKEAGRDTYRFYTAAMNANAVRRLDLDNALRRALEQEEFLLHYQPKIEVVSGRWTGVEALLRWNRPGHGLVAPGEFIPLLEETGLIEPVGVWVIDAACRQIAAWTNAGIGPVPVAVNVSVKQLLRGRVDQQVRRKIRGVEANDQLTALEPAVDRALREHRLASNLLEIELTESTLMQNAAKTVGLLQRLKALGIRISIDDFGTGYSSLAYLKRFPIDTIKIDQTFIRDVTSDPDDAAIAVAIISLAHSLKLKVIAEGVETREQLDFLRVHGCDEAQGYYMARPMPADAITTLFASSRSWLGENEIAPSR